LRSSRTTRTPGITGDCEVRGEIGIISDLDRTVIPHHSESRPDAPYPGITTLYQILEFGADGQGEAGDFTYVTARTPDLVVGVPEWLELHGVPAGPIETGVSGIPWLAQDAKIEDVARTFAASPGQAFVLFGDTSHRDPEVYMAMRASHPSQVRAGMIHRVNQTVSTHRLEGLHLFHNYAECAAILVGLDILAEADAWRVFEAAVGEGLKLSEAEFGALLDDNRR
jgi:phosphatidate phosphatase APP1